MNNITEPTAAAPCEPTGADLAEELREQARRFATLARHVIEDELAQLFRQAATDLFAHALEIERDQRRPPSP